MMNIWINSLVTIIGMDAVLPVLTLSDISMGPCRIPTDVGPSFDHPVAGELSCNAVHLTLVMYLRF
jgi:hypothetical protein